MQAGANLHTLCGHEVHCPCFMNMAVLTAYSVISQTISQED